MKLGRFLTPFLKSEDITEPITATITKIVVEEVRGQDGKIKKKEVAFFKEFDKGLVLGFVTTNQLKAACKTDEVEGVIGKKITLFFDPTVTMNTEIVGGITIKV